MSSDEAPVFYADARDGLLTSSADSRRKALKHLDCFLEGYCVQIDIDPTKGEDIPYHGIPPKTTEKEIFKFWDDLMGAFVTYLGKHARAACNPTAPRISKGTSAGYLSAVKNFFAASKFRTEPAIPVFQKAPFKKLTEKLQGMHRESNRANGKVETEEVSSTRRDREAISTACIWMGTPEFAEFWHLSNASFHCCGRGSETSLIKSIGVIPVEISEMMYRYDVLAVQLQRQKNGPFQTLPIYPCRDGMLEDFYFSLIHLILVKGCNHEYVLPQFSQAALKTKKSGESSSDVSRQWASFFEGIRNAFEILADEINEELGSHSNRRGGNQSLAENPSVPGFAPIYRSGIKPKNLATIFDYLFGSFELLRQAGKGLAGWVTKTGDCVLGGQPPTFDDITTEKKSLQRFTDTIFEDDTEGRWQPRVRELLVMSLLLRYDEFVDVLHAHPFAKLTKLHDEEHPFKLDDDYTTSHVKTNIFLNRVNQALENAGIHEFTEDKEFDRTFSEWCSEAKEAFISRNAPALPINRLPSRLQSGYLMDTRSLIDHYNQLASVVQANHMELQRQRHVLNDIQQAFNVESKITSSFIIEKLFSMEKSIRRLEENLLPEASKPTPPPKSNVLMFSVSSKCLSTSASLSEITTAFFVDDYRKGYDLETKSPAWTELTENEKKKLRHRFSLIRRVVRLVLMHADSFPTWSENRVQYKKDVFALARVAEEKIRVALSFDVATITRHKLEKQPGLRELERTLKLPSTTPEDWIKFFKS